MLAARLASRRPVLLRPPFTRSTRSHGGARLKAFPPSAAGQHDQKQQRAARPAGPPHHQTHQPRRTTMAAAAPTTLSAEAQRAAPLDGPPVITALIDRLNQEYLDLHRSFEDQFWATKMGLSHADADALSAGKTKMEAWLADGSNLAAVRAAAATPGAGLSPAPADPALADLAAATPSPAQARTLAVLARTFEVNQLPTPAAAALRAELNSLEAGLQEARNGMKLGYTDPASGAFVEASGVQLRNRMRTAPDEATRKACYDALRSVGPAVLPSFCEIVKKRNALARECGSPNFYEMKLQAAEGMGLATLFGDLLGPLEAGTRPTRDAALATLAATKGADAVQPWNRGFALAGESEAALDPFFPFASAVGTWARSFAALGIGYARSTMRLDLIDRPGKYSNGFCHWPVPPFNSPASGEHTAAVTNFTSLADPRPSAVGSGRVALTTLLHEGGHAAHFANVASYTPLCSQERAPTSVAYAETQSMFLDALADDAAFLARYARNAAGEPIPWEVVEAHIRATQPYKVFALRAMLAVSFFEYALYSLDDADVTPDRVAALADEVEASIEGGPSPRPLLSVPHILADESSAYYQGYTLAEMAVHQTRAAFKARFGGLVDDARVGPALASGFWSAGNATPFPDLVRAVTGADLSAAAWIADLNRPLDAVLAEEKAAFEAGLAAGPRIPPGSPVDLNMRVLLVHGDGVVADTAADGGLVGAEAKFKAWLDEEYGGVAASA
jgi:oligoendopeptidase F